MKKKIFKQEKSKTLWLCASCNSDKVEVKSWVNLNTNEISGEVSDGDDNDNWCKDCEGHNPVYQSKLKASAKVVGFQVVGKEETPDEGNIHPDMAGSFCLYNLSQAREMTGKHGYWNLLTIWSGDVEEPTIMFEGDPRK